LKNNKNSHKNFLVLALHEAEKCQNIEYFGVGCLIINAQGEIISTGFTNEIPNEHAEEVALKKVSNLENCTLYSTLEPCSVRLSTKKSCTSRIIESGIKLVVFGTHEPKDFVDCCGERLLLKAGIEVIQLKELENECKVSIISKRKNRPK